MAEEISSKSSKTAKTKKVKQSQLKGRRFGRILTKLGKITRDQVHEALAIQKVAQKKGKEEKIGAIMLEMGAIKEADILQALAGQQGMAWEDIVVDDIPQAAIDALQIDTVTTYGIVPLAYDEDTHSITIALKSPDNYRAIDDMRTMLGFSSVTAVVSPPDHIQEVIKKRYTAALLDKDSLLASLDSVDLQDLTSDGDTSGASAASSNVIIKYVQSVITRAIRDKASDIHFEPFEEEFKLKYRIDGILYEMQNPPMDLKDAIVSRIKILSKLNISERRLPQDGRIEMNIQGSSTVDLRVSILPTMFGESVVLRVLDRSNVQLSLDRIGLGAAELDKVYDIIRRPNGIVVVTGPTGSGKTTTLYAALSELNQVSTKVLTAEDPVEYDIYGLVQCQINVAQGLTFARLLRSFLRQDPDIILVGETRDLETAQIAVQAALTGHLVFTTLHTNDAPSTILRLVDLGIETFLITATVEAIIAQRLVRRICIKCKEEYTPTHEELLELKLHQDDIEGRTFFRGKGCDSCRGSGYRGRLAIFEIMEFDDAISELILAQASTSVLRSEAQKRGMRTLRESGLYAIYDGQTTIDEVVRETMIDE